MTEEGFGNLGAQNNTSCRLVTTGRTSVEHSHNCRNEVTYTYKSDQCPIFLKMELLAPLKPMSKDVRALEGDIPFSLVPVLEISMQGYCISFHTVSVDSSLLMTPTLPYPIASLPCHMTTIAFTFLLLLLAPFKIPSPPLMVPFLRS